MGPRGQEVQWTMTGWQVGQWWIQILMAIYRQSWRGKEQILMIARLKLFSYLNWPSWKRSYMGNLELTGWSVVSWLLRCSSSILKWPLLFPQWVSAISQLTGHCFLMLSYYPPLLWTSINHYRIKYLPFATTIEQLVLTFINHYRIIPMNQYQPL